MYGNRCSLAITPFIGLFIKLLNILKNFVNPNPFSTVHTYFGNCDVPNLQQLPLTDRFLICSLFIKWIRLITHLLKTQMVQSTPLLQSVCIIQTFQTSHLLPDRSCKFIASMHKNTYVTQQMTQNLNSTISLKHDPARCNISTLNAKHAYFTCYTSIFRCLWV